jgi:trehalose 6-phosphate synthase
VGLSQREIEEYYEGFSNATLWPLFHDVLVPAIFHREWWSTYREVNDRFAQAIVEVSARGATVWVHDYHLQLVPQMVRSLRPDLRIGWFNHVPFPPVELFAHIPWRRAMLEGLLGADFLGFQQAADAENFLRACGQLLSLPTGQDSVTLTSPVGAPAHRTVQVDALPISVDFQSLDALARSQPVVTAAAEFRASLGDPEVLVLGVDRLDYTKGIRHRLKAYEELLRDKAVEPAEITLVQAGLPSRERITAYRVLREEVEATVRSINDEYSAVDCTAVHLLHQYLSRPEMAAMFRAADVMLVTPLRDGMNLVAKEYVACRPDLGGALVLSEFTGAWHELKHEAFACNPHDIDGTKRAIMSAITTPAHERRRRMEALRGHVAGHDVQQWAADFLEALARAPSSPAS